MANTAAERGREVRQQLMLAAAELIPERGWTAVSTRLVAERAGTAAGLVHYHFSSLQALLREAAVGGMRDAMAGLPAVLQGAQTPREAVDRLLGSLSAYTGRDPTSLLFTETYLAATRDQELQKAVAALLTEFRDQVTPWLAAHSVAAPAESAMVLAAVIDGVLLHRALDPQLTAEAVAPILLRMFDTPD